MRARHWLAEGVILLLSGFAAFAQGPAGTGVTPTKSGSQETTASSTNSTADRGSSAASQQSQQEQNNNKNSNAPSSGNAAPAPTPVASSGAVQESNAPTANTTQQPSSNTIQPGQAAHISSAPSLGDAARKSREQKQSSGASAPKPAKVFTNDDLDRGRGSSNVAAPSADAPAAGGATNKSSGSIDQQEKEWRDKFAKAHAKLQRDQAELDVDQRELGKLQVQFYPNDPAKQLGQSVSNADVHTQQDKIAKMQQQVQNDQNDISSLEDSLRKSGGDSGWAR